MAGALGNLLIMLTADTAQARSDIGKAAHQVERDMKDMQVAATAAGVVIADTITAIGRSFVNAAKDAIQFGDQLNKMSQKTNFSVERLSEMAFAAELADVSISQMNGGLGQFNKVLSDAAKEGSKAASVFKALGVDITQGPQVAFEQFAKAINSIPDGEAKVATMRAVFGRAGDALLPMLKGLDDATEKARALGLTISTQMAADAEKFNDSMTVLGTTMRSLALTAMEPLTVWLANVAEGMATAKANGNLLKNTLLELGMLWASLWGGIAEGVGAAPMARVMEEEFRRLKALQDGLRGEGATPGASGGWGASGGGSASNPEELACVVSGGKWINGKCVAKAGKTGKGKSSNAERDWLGRQLQEGMDEEAKVMAEAAAATDKYNQAVRDREAAEVAAEIAAQVARAESIIQMEEIIDQQTRMKYGWDENGKKIAESTKKANDFAREMGLTFTSAFESAVLSGKKLSDVLRGLAKDIAQVILRKTVTEPLGAAISKGIGGIFEGISFAGGGYTGNGPRTGGLDGQGGFMAMLHPQETVTDHAFGGSGGSGGITIVQNISIDSRSDRSCILQAMAAAKDQAKSEIMASLNRGGEFAMATGRA